MKTILKELVSNEEVELSIFNLDCIPPQMSKFFFNDKLYVVFDVFWYHKETKFAYEKIEPYVEILLVES